MVLSPFGKKNSQKLASIIVMIIGVLLLVTAPVIPVGGFNLSGFIIGAIITLIGFVYFLDVQ